nr:unnamed protein product [Callosobruchus chinensis]
MQRLTSSEENSVIAPVVRFDSILVQDDSNQVSPVDAYSLEEGNIGGSAPLVVLDNSAVNIENSSDVVIGPVTNFNVNGNVTIFQESKQRHLTDEENQTEDETTLTTTPPKPTNFWKVKFSSLPKTTRLFVVSLLAAIVGTIIACAVIFTKKSGTSPELDPDYFGNNLGTHPVYYKETWGGKPPHDKIHLKLPPKVVIQFLIGGDGAIYVGRGWNSTNFHMMSQYSIGICFVGNFNQDVLSADMIQAAELLMEKGLNLGALDVNYQVVGQNQTTKYQPMSPGSNAVDVIKKWPRYSSIIFFKH